jgi:hypothetical protein
MVKRHTNMYLKVRAHLAIGKERTYVKSGNWYRKFLLEHIRILQS